MLRPSKDFQRTSEGSTNLSMSTSIFSCVVQRVSAPVPASTLYTSDGLRAEDSDRARWRLSRCHSIRPITPTGSLGWATSLRSAVRMMRSTPRPSSLATKASSLPSWERSMSSMSHSMSGVRTVCWPVARSM